MDKPLKYQTELSIIRSNFSKTESARFKGKLYIVSNKYGVIYDWKIEFCFIEIDLLTTSSWFKSKNKNFTGREELFSELNLKQEKRKRKSDHKTLELNTDQIEIVNNYFNDRKKYNSTLKNIVAVLKGNNPVGEAKKPKSAELILNTDKNIRNFVILLDDLIMKDSHKINYTSALLNAKKIDFDYFIKLNPTLEAAFKFMQQEKNYESWINYLNEIKKYYKQFNVDIKCANRIANKARSRFSKNVDSVKPLPFNYESKIQFQKCHIYEFHILRDLLIEAIRENKEDSKSEILNMISDSDNFIPLPENIHRQFDANNLTYNEEGHMLPLTDDGKIFIDKYVDDKFKSIPSYFLNQKRLMYIKLRNYNITKNSH